VQVRKPDNSERFNSSKAIRRAFNMAAGDLEAVLPDAALTEVLLEPYLDMQVC